MKKFHLKSAVSNVHIKEGDKIRLDHPPAMFPLHFTMALIGGTNSGKTTACINVVSAYINYHSFNHVFLICPTADENISFQRLHLPRENVYAGANAAKNPIACIEDVISRIGQAKIEYDQNEIYKQAWLRHQRGTATVEDEIMLQVRHFRPPENLPFPSPALILDDLSHTEVYSTSRGNPFNNLFLRHRHIHGVGISIFLLVQNFRSGIPLHIRQNIRVYCLWHTHDEKQLQAMFEELATVCDKDQFYTVYDEATRTPHHFLCVDLYNEDPALRFRENFDKVLVLPETLKKRKKHNEHEIN